MTKITQEFARVLAHRISKKAIEERIAALIAFEDKLVEDIHAHLVPAAELKAMKKLPENFFLSSSTIHVPHRDYSHRNLKHSTKTFLMPAFFASSVAEDMLSQDLWVRIKERNGESDNIKQHEQEINSSAYRKILGASTLKRLIEAWPAVKDHLLPEELKPASYALPALSFEDLDRMIAKAGVPANAPKTPSAARKAALAQLKAQKEAA